MKRPIKEVATDFYDLLRNKDEDVEVRYDENTLFVIASKPLDLPVYYEGYFVEVI